MAEKKGNLETLIYDFRDSNCEVQINEKWFRTTPREFRSWKGKRRIDGVEYEGPIYFFGTNKKTKATDAKEGIVFINSVDPRQKSQPRN